MNQFKAQILTRNGLHSEMIKAKDLVSKLDNLERLWLEDMVLEYKIYVWSNQGEGLWIEIDTAEADAWAMTMTGEM